MPGLVNNSVTQTLGIAGVHPEARHADAAFLTPPNLDPAAGQLQRLRIRAVANDAPKTTTYQASFGVQQRAARRRSSRRRTSSTREGPNLASLVNLNQPMPSAPGAHDARGAVPYPNFGFIEWRAQNGKSTYKGVDIGLEKRFAHGYAFGVSYTLGDSQDNTSEQLTTQGSNAFPQDSRDFSNWYGPSDYDVRHRFTTNFVVALPLGENVVRARLDGLRRVSPPDRAGRSRSIRATTTSGTNMTGLPNQVGDPDGPQTVDQWFNSGGVPGGARLACSATSCAIVCADRASRRSTCRSSGVQVPARAYAATVRWDVFNLFNTTNFGLPNRNSRTPRRSRRSRACRATRGSCSWRCA